MGNIALKACDGTCGKYTYRALYGWYEPIIVEEYPDTDDDKVEDRD